MSSDHKLKKYVQKIHDEIKHLYYHIHKHSTLFNFLKITCKMEYIANMRFIHLDFNALL